MTDLGALGIPLLDAIFAEMPDAGFVGGADHFGAERFGDRDEANFLGAAAGADGGTGDALANARDGGGNR
jgi:hypothetical protein